MNQRLPIDVLRALRSIVELGSVTRAAESLNLSQSAVSWKIKRLEKQLGCDLIRREVNAWWRPTKALSC
jgi:DNA-binding transcriptional LysR family regulator